MKFFVRPDNSRTQNVSKSENGVIPVTLKWKNFLGADTITTSTWEADNGLSIDSSSNGNDETEAVISSGKEGEKLLLTNKIVTAGGKTYEHDVFVMIKVKGRRGDGYGR